MMKNLIIDPCVPYGYTGCIYGIRKLAIKYGDILSFRKTGMSTRGRNIYLVRLGKGRRKILLVGGMHGREYVTTGFLLACLEYYSYLYTQDEELCGYRIKDVLSEYSFYALPQCNPDSTEIALGREKPLFCQKDFCAVMYKDNAKGVNINANFPFEWTQVPDFRHPGKFAASERETKNLIILCRKYSFEKMLSLHCRGGCIYWRDGKNGIVAQDETLAKKLNNVCGFTLCESTNEKAAYSGGFENWFRYEFKRPGLCVELIKNDNAPFDMCCKNFYEYTDWQRTKKLLAAIL